MTKMPNSRRNLDIAIQRLAGSPQGLVEARTVVADAIVAQLLPDGAVKGGSALKIRFGDASTRFSSDLDTARRSDIEGYAARLESSLRVGWEGFTGTLVPRSPAHPEGVPDHYVMKPFDVKLSYLGKPWVTVPLEVGHNEIGDADDPDMVLPEDAARILAALGFPPPSPVPLMPLHHQIAQKIHAASSPGSSRAHDLIDLQVIVGRGSVDLPRTRETCVRLFAYRQAQAWPPVVRAGDGWDALYADQAEGLGVLQSLEDAVAWTNELIERIDRSR